MIIVTGALTNPLDQAIAFADIRLTAVTSTREVPKEATASYLTAADGSYNFSLLTGTYLLECNASDEYHIQGVVTVDEETPSPIGIFALLDYTPALIPTVIIPDTPEWATLHSNLRNDVDTTVRTKVDSLTHLTDTASEVKQLIENERINATIAENNTITRVGTIESKQQTATYEDTNLNQSVQVSESTVSKNAEISSSVELYDASNSAAHIVTKEHQKTLTGAHSKEVNVSDTAATFKEETLVSNTGFKQESTTTPTSVEFLKTTLVTEGDSVIKGLNQELLTTDSITLTNGVSLDVGIHHATVDNTQTAFIDINDLVQALQSRGLTVYDKVLYERQTNNGTQTRIDKNPDIYNITDEAGTSVFEVDTVNKEINLNARLIVNNPEDFKGESGDTIYEVYQYSADNLTWFDAYTVGYNYRRHATSVNGVVTAWSTGYKITGADGLDGDTYYNEYNYSTFSKDGPWHVEYIDEDMYRRWRTISAGKAPTAWIIEVMRGSNGVDGEITEVAYQYSTDGFIPWHSNFSTGDHYRRERVEYFTSVNDRDLGNPYLVTPWTSAAQIVPLKGVDYLDGSSNAVVYLYQRGILSPVLPTTALTYNFGTLALTGDLEGWSTGVPTGTNTIWITAATASSITTTDVIEPNEWVDAAILGSSPYNQATVNIYQRSATLPAGPTVTLSYDFTTGALTGDLGNWVHGKLPTGVDDLYMATASVVAQYTLANIASNDWGIGILTSSVFKQESVHLYQRASSLPLAPTADITYNFTDGTITGSLGAWSKVLPEGVHDVYIAIAVASGNSNVDVIPSTHWSVGLLGASGYQTHVITLYQDSVNTPTLPSNETAYDFVTKSLTVLPNNGWGTLFPTNTTGKIWVTSATANGSALAVSDIIPASEWDDAQVFLESGMQVASVTLYRISGALLHDTDLPTLAQTYSFLTGKLTSTPDNGWSTIPVSNVSTLPVWITTASVSTLTVNSEDTINPGEWTTPTVLVKSGSTIHDVYEYSINGINNWHVVFQDGDIYRRTAISTNGILSAWTVAKLAGIDGTSVLVRLVSDGGFFFRNNAGAVKVISAEIWVNGELATDYAAYNFHWKVGDATVYASATGDFVGTTPVGGFYPADGEAVGGLNFHTLNIDFSDVVDGGNLNLTCVVTNI